MFAAPTPRMRSAWRRFQPVVCSPVVRRASTGPDMRAVASLRAPDRIRLAVAVAGVPPDACACCWRRRRGGVRRRRRAAGVGAWQSAWRPTLRVAFESVAQRRTRRGGGPRPSTAAGRLGDGLRWLEFFATMRRRARPDLAERRRHRGSRPSPLGLPMRDRAHESGPRRRDSHRRRRTADRRSCRNGARGRRIATAATLRRPSRYLDPGVPDQERALARRGTTLVGHGQKRSAGRGACARGSPAAEAAASMRAFARRAIRACRRPLEHPLRRDRHGHRHRRSHRARRRGAAAVAGGGHLPRDRDFGRQHRDSRRAGAVGFPHRRSARAWRDGVRDRRSRRLRLCRRRRCVGRSRHADGGDLLRRAGARLARAADEHAGAGRRPPAVADPLAIADPAFLLTFGATAAILVVMPVVPIQAAAPASSRRVVDDRGRVGGGRSGADAGGATIFSRVTFAGLLLNLARHSVDGGGADRRDGGPAALCGVRGWPRRRRMARARAAPRGWFGAPGSSTGRRWSPGACAPPSAVAMLIYYLGAGRRMGRVALASGRVRTAAAFASRPELERAARARRAGGGTVDPRRPGAVRDRAGRRPAPRHVHRRRSGRRRAGAISRAARRCSSTPAGSAADRRFDIGDRVVAPVLRQAGVRRLDTLVLTHGDADHIGGAAALMRDFRPWDVWEGVPVPPFEPLQPLLAGARRAPADPMVDGPDRRRHDGRRRARSSCAIRGRRTGSARMCATTIRSSWSCCGAMCRWC